MFDKHHKKESPTFTGITRGVGGFGFGVAAGAGDDLDDNNFVSTFGGNNSSYATYVRDLDVDSSGNIYAIGYVNYSYVTQGTDIYLIKYRKDGSVAWSKHLYASSYGTDHDEGYKIKVGSSGDIFFSGTTRYQNFSGIGGWSNIVGKYNPSGVLQWLRVVGGSSDDEARAMALDSSDNVYVGGMTMNVTSNTMGLIVKYNSSGTLQWQRYMGNTGSGASTWIYGMDLDSSGNIYVVGTHTPAGSSARNYVGKYDSSGVRQWERTINTSSTYESALSIDSSDNIYAIARSASGNKYVVMKYNTSGTIQWQKNFADGAGAAVILNDIYAASDGYIYMVGGARISGSDNSDDVIMIKIDSSGTIISQRGLGEIGYSNNQPNPRDDIGYGIKVTNDHIYACGYTESIDTNSTPSSSHKGLVFKVPNDDGATLYGIYDTSANDGVTTSNLITYGGLGSVGGVDYMAKSQTTAYTLTTTTYTESSVTFYSNGDASSYQNETNAASTFTDTAIDTAPTLYLIDGVTGYSAGPHPGFP